MVWRYMVARMRHVEVRLLGRFEVLVDSREVPADAWAQRRAARGAAAPGGALGGGAARRPSRRGGPPRTHAPQHRKRRQSVCRAPGSLAARRAFTARRGALRGDTGA